MWWMWMQGNTIVFRADKAMLDKIRTTAKGTGCSNSKVIRDALTLYYEPDTSTLNQGLQAHMQQEIMFLRGELDRVHNEMQAFMLSRSSLLQRVVARLRG